MTFKEARALLDAPLPTPADIEAALDLLPVGSDPSRVAAALARARSGGADETHAAGDRDRFYRCKLDLARALGLPVVDGGDLPEWAVLLDDVRGRSEAHAADMTEGRLSALAEVVADAVSEDGRTYADGRESMRRDILALDRWSAVGVEAIRAIEPAMGPAPSEPAAPTLTNCDSCRHDYMDPPTAKHPHRWCAAYKKGDRHPDIDAWCRDNIGDHGAPLPGATGCPGYAPKPAPATPKEGE